MNYLRIALGTLCLFVLLAGVANPAFANSAALEEASVLYEQGDYKRAYKKYLKLGKKGDSFSAYRVSYMQLYGQGTRADSVESLAWATIAAQQGEQDLVAYRDAVAAVVPKEQRKKAGSKVDYYMRRWGEKQENDDRGSNRGCTGSRVSANCNPTGSRQQWINWPKETSELQVMQETIEQLDQSIAEDFNGSSSGS